MAELNQNVGDVMGVIMKSATKDVCCDLMFNNIQDLMIQVI